MGGYFFAFLSSYFTETNYDKRLYAKEETSMGEKYEQTCGQCKDKDTFICGQCPYGQNRSQKTIEHLEELESLSAARKAGTIGAVYSTVPAV